MNFKTFGNFFSDLNPTKLYLILANVVLVVFGIWFANVGVLPFKNFGDFAFFTLLWLVLALYRPGWAFVLFSGLLALENINLAPAALGLNFRPYQFLAFLLILAILGRFLAKKMSFSWPKLSWIDAMPVLFVLGGLLSGLMAPEKGATLKQALVASSFVAIYFLTRIYIQSWDDLKKVVPFFLSSGAVILFYAIWQNWQFLHGGQHFEVMPGRPNGTFTEADWLGIYGVFLMAVLLTLIFGNKLNFLSRKKISLELLSYLFLTLASVVLILTVSRSAWVGGAVLLLVFLKLTLLDYPAFVPSSGNRWQSLRNLFRLGDWRWRKAGKHLGLVVLALVFALAFSLGIPLTNFQLGKRAASTGGLQKITISCQDSKANVPAQIGNVSELAQYGCRHINLEEIASEKAAGRFVREISRPDPNVKIRAEIYRQAIAQIKLHPLMGIGWGSISKILGQDERGAGLNASNIFLEIWLGAGILGVLSFVTLLLYVLIAAIRMFLVGKKPEATTFVFLGWVAIVIPNLFNSGIFLGFVWAYLAVAVSVLNEQNFNLQKKK